MKSNSKQNRILFINLNATFGGAEIYLENLLQMMQGHVACYVLCADRELQRRLFSFDVTVFRIFRASGFLKILQLFCACCMLPYILVRHRIQTVQINGYSEIILLPLARCLGRTTVATRHLSFEIEVDHWHQAPGRFAARFLYQRLARFASRIICVSREVGNEVGPLTRSNCVTVIPNWVASIPPYRARPSPLASPVNVLFVGRMVKHKGLQILIEAMHQLSADSADRDLRLTAVGDGPYRSELERHAAGLNAQFVGFQSNVTPFYDSADIFVSPSLGPEGSSLVALEAMSQCLPCILSDLDVHREISNDGETAVLFRSGDVADLAVRLRSLIERDEQRRSYIDAAYNSVQEKHNPNKAAKEYLNAFGG